MEMLLRLLNHDRYLGGLRNRATGLPLTAENSASSMRMRLALRLQFRVCSGSACRPLTSEATSKPLFAEQMNDPEAKRTMFKNAGITSGSPKERKNDE